jgi:hypothetical protein
MYSRTIVERVKESKSEARLIITGTNLAPQNRYYLRYTLNQIIFADSTTDQNKIKIMQYAMYRKITTSQDMCTVSLLPKV